MNENSSELKNIIEAAMLVAGEPLTMERILDLFAEGSQPAREDIRDALKSLESDYEGRGIELRQVDKGYRFQSRDRYATWLGRLFAERPPRYSRAILETLAIIAYRQPVTRGDIEEIRGVTVSSDIMRQLLDRQWVRQVGQRDVPGKPSLYGTTREFLEYFSLKSLKDLPTLAELRDLEEISRELNLPLGLGEDMEDASETQEAAASSEAGDQESREAADDGELESVVEDGAAPLVAATDSDDGAEPQA